MSVGQTARPSRDKWTPDLDAKMMDLVADGYSFGAIGDVLNLSRHNVYARFERLRHRMGAQAQ